MLPCRLFSAAGLSLAAGLFLFPPDVRAGPVINEILYRPCTGFPENTAEAFLEIHNPDAAAVDLRIAIDDFMRVELRVAKVLAAEHCMAHEHDRRHPLRDRSIELGARILQNLIPGPAGEEMDQNDDHGQGHCHGDPHHWYPERVCSQP